MTTTSNSAIAPATRRQIMMGSSFLLSAAVLWGVGFYAQRVSVEETTPLWAVALRFGLAVPLALGAWAWRRAQGIRIPWRAGAVLGVLLYLVFALQTVALVHTSVSRVALITALYSVFVPVLQPLFGLPRPRLLQLVAVGIGLLSLVLLCGVIGDQASLATPPNVGDFYTLIMAVIAAVLVLLIAHFAPREDTIALNAVQIMTMATCAFVIAPLLEGPPPTHIGTPTFFSLVYLAVASTFLAFWFQMLGQRHVSPSTASILMMVETPIGVVAAVVILHEAMADFQWAGAFLALVAVAVAVAAEKPA